MGEDLTAGRRSRRLVVADLIAETADSMSIVLAVPEQDRSEFGYRPGQFLTLRIPSDRTGSVARCYSLASSPHCDDDLRVIVKRTAEGYASNWLCDNLHIGAELEVLPPSGVFSPKTLDEDLVLFAGGSGITPMLSIAKSALTAGTARVSLFYASRNEASVIGAAEWRELAAGYAGRVTVVHWLESLQGLPSCGDLAAFAQPFAGREAFICGPAPFMEMAQQALRAAGQPREHIHVEVFSSLSGDPFAEYAPAPATGQDGTVEVEVDLEGAIHRLAWPRGVRLLDYMLGLGIDVPYMCRSGECGTCQATCTSGQVTMLGNELLDEADVAAGYVLTCQLLPDGEDQVTIVF